VSDLCRKCPVKGIAIKGTKHSSPPDREEGLHLMVGNYDNKESFPAQ